MHKQVLILKFLNFLNICLKIMKCHFQYIDMRETHRRHRSMLGQWLQMSKQLIKIINIHRTIYEEIDEPYFGYLKYFLNCLLKTVKIIRTSHKRIHMKSRGRLKPLLLKKFYMCRWLLSVVKKWSRRVKRVKAKKYAYFKDIL